LITSSKKALRIDSRREWATTEASLSIFNPLKDINQTSTFQSLKDKRIFVNFWKKKNPLIKEEIQSSNRSIPYSNNKFRCRKKTYTLIDIL